MNSTRVTIVLFTIAAVLAVAVPGIRESIDALLIESTLGRPDRLPSPAEVQRVCQQRPEDAQLWLGRAEYLAGLRTAQSRVDMGMEWGAWESYWARLERRLPAHIPSEGDVTVAYQAARAVDAGPAVLTRAALWAMPPLFEVSLLHDASEPLPTLTLEQRRQIDDSRTLLSAWHAQEPDSGTPSVLIAWGHVAEDDMGAAMNALDRLSQADRWRTHARAAFEAQGELLRAAGSRTDSDDLFASDAAPHLKARHLGRFLASRAHEPRRAGDYRRAVRLYVATLRIGVLLAESPNGIDFLSAGTVLALAAAEDAPPSQPHASREQMDQRNLAGMQGLAAYLSQHGAGTVGESAVEALRRYSVRRAEYSQASKAARAQRWAMWGSPPVTNARIIWWTLIVLALLAGLAGIVALATIRVGRYEPRQWRWWEWLALAALLIAPMQVWFGLLAKPMGPPEIRLPEATGEITEEMTRRPLIPLRLQMAIDDWLLPAAAMVGAWVLMAAGAAYDRRRLERRPTGAMNVFRDVLRLAAPTLALLVLLSVLAAPLIYARAQQIQRRDIGKIEVGELVFYGIMEQEDGPHSPAGESATTGRHSG